jgi:hypothetical protein
MTEVYELREFRTGVEFAYEKHPAWKEAEALAEKEISDSMSDPEGVWTHSIRKIKKRPRISKIE